MSLKILGTGSYLPPKVVTNEDLAKTLDTSDEWIFAHSGIHSRHVVGPEGSTSSSAVRAASAALESAGVAASEIDAIVVATCSPDYLLPSTASFVHKELGCAHACAFDVAAACTGFVYALEMARGYLTLHPGAKALVIGAETLSRIVDWSDRASCILFGDGAGAVVVGSDDTPSDGFCRSYLRTDGTGYAYLMREGGVCDPGGFGMRAAPLLKMSGKPVFQFAVKALPKVVERLCGEAGIATSDIDLFVPHQANIRIIDSAARRLGISCDRVFTNIDSVANTSGASIPIAIDQAVRSGRLRDGMKVCLVGFGAGLTYGGMLARWPFL
ncbi:MAG: ketoacyl-ACP synthase III [Kiritimatiellae bacterium]|nr:ketoacyl-ACP synthase III [Kiritimatiellia bacterium]